jgi:hypothetical protein
MDDFIKVYDNIVPFSLQEKIKNSILQSQIPLFYVHNIANEYSSTPSPGFGSTFIDFTNGKHTEYSFLFLEVIYYLSKHLHFLIEKVYQARAFVHLPSPNPGLDEIHTDLNFPHWVCLYYINDSEGNTVFFNNDKKTKLKEISPKQGRIVFFNGLIPHCSSRPETKTRAILNFNFQGYKFGKEKEN